MMKRTCVYIMAFLSVWMAQAQIVNKGVAYLSPDTEMSAIYSFTNQADAEFYNDGEAYFYQSLINEGQFDFYQTTGSNYFRGNTLQNISGSQPIYFHDLHFQNQGPVLAFHLKTEAHVTNLAYFTKGIVDSKSFGGQLIFEEGAKAQGPWDNSHVMGAVVKIGNDAFTYPIGKEGFYRPAGTSGSLQTNGFTGEYFFENSNTLHPHNMREPEIIGINNREYWRVERAENIGEEQFITLSYHNTITPADYLAAAEGGNLVIVRWDNQQMRWINEGGGIDFENKRITAPVRKFGVFTLGKINPDHDEECVVEVFNLIDINGANQNKYMRLESDCAYDYAVRVFNRWGVKVFETKRYGIQGEGDVFDGFSSGRLTINKKDHLPTGTYFYILDYRYDSGMAIRSKQEVGYVYVRGE